VIQPEPAALEDALGREDTNMSTPEKPSGSSAPAGDTESTAVGKQLDPEETLDRAEEELRRLELQEEEALLKLDEEVARIRAEKEIARARARHALSHLEVEEGRRERARRRSERDDDLDRSRSRNRPREREGTGRARRTRSYLDEDRDLPGRSLDATADVVRAGSAAYAEGLRSFADVVGSFADSFSDRTRAVRRRDRFGEPEVETRSRGRRGGGRPAIADLPSETYGSLLDAVDEYLQVPSRTIDRFYESYRGSSAR
jgi:hypothetical protein